MTKIKIGSDFSGVGAFNQALIRLGIAYEEVFACDMDKYARQTFVWDVSDSQAYKQAGNSICVGVLVEIIKKLKL